MPDGSIVLSEQIEASVHVLRGQNVLLDGELADLYGVSVTALNQAVKRNPDRFPADFMFQVTAEERETLLSRNVMSKLAVGTERRGGRRTLPYAFTEQGVAMLSSVLKSKRAAQVNVEVMRTFVRLRRMLAGNAELAGRLEELEKHYDKQFRAVFDAIRELMAPPQPERPPIGFTRKN